MRRVGRPLALLLGLAVTSLASAEAEHLQLFPLYDRYTVEGGKLALAYLDALGEPDVRSFQAKHGLAVDDIVGASTLARLRSEKPLLRERADARELELQLIQEPSGAVVLRIINTSDRKLMLAACDAKPARVELHTRFGGVSADGQTYDGGGKEILPIRSPAEIPAGGFCSVPLPQPKTRAPHIRLTATCVSRNGEVIGILQSPTLVLKDGSKRNRIRQTGFPRITRINAGSGSMRR